MKIYNILSIINRILPKKKNKIVFYGRQIFENNHHAMIQYLIKNGYNKKYKLYLVVARDIDALPYQNNINVFHIKGAFASIYHTLTAKFVFHCYGMGRMKNKVPSKQIVFDIWHGTALKALDAFNDKTKESSTYMLATSDFAKEYFKKCFGYEESQFFICGYPRCDYLFEQKSSLEKMGIDKSDYKKVVLFMPTFRKAKRLGYNDSSIDFPLFDIKTLQVFNEFLKQKNILFIIKPHPEQDQLDILNLSLSNVKIIKNNDLAEKQVNLYSIVADADILISDYSSIFFDFLLTQKPIGFVIDDLCAYKSQRGFSVDNPLEYMPGVKIKSILDLENFIEDTVSGIDKWQEERRKINDLVNYDKEGGYCRKIFDFLGINKI